MKLDKAWLCVAAPALLMACENTESTTEDAAREVSEELMGVCQKPKDSSGDDCPVSS